MYEHTQRNLMLFAITGLAGALPMLAIVVLHPGGMGPTERWVLFAGAVLSLALGIVFCRMTIRVDSVTLAWHFAFGALRKSVAIADIESIEPTTAGWADGWGIHLTSRGWLYNIAGREAALVTMKGGTRFLLGTDEPATLGECVRQHLQIAHQVR